MLERVGAGQTRFTIPGLTVDSRGVATGRQMVVRFTALDRMIAFLRLWSGEQALEPSDSSLRLVYARVAGGPRDALVMLSLPSATLGDAVARAARLAGGQCFVGGGKHFVQHRVRRAPSRGGARHRQRGALRRRSDLGLRDRERDPLRQAAPHAGPAARGAHPADRAGPGHVSPHRPPRVGAAGAGVPASRARQAPRVARVRGAVRAARRERVPPRSRRASLASLRARRASRCSRRSSTTWRSPSGTGIRCTSAPVARPCPSSACSCSRPRRAG